MDRMMEIGGTHNPAARDSQRKARLNCDGSWSAQFRCLLPGPRVHASPCVVEAFRDDGFAAAAHALEVPLLFRELDRNTVSGRADAPQMFEVLADYWTSFARTGDPNCAGRPEWPRFTAEGQGAMVLDLPPHPEFDYRAEERLVWSGEPILPSWSGAPAR